MSRSVSPVLTLSLALAAGCASSGGGVRAAGLPKFPSRAEIEQITAGPARTPTFAQAQSVQRWALADPLPTVIGTTPHESTSPAGALVTATFAADPRIRPSAGMQCVAREYGRFVLAHDAMPAPELETFIEARCGEPIKGTSIDLRVGEEAGASSLAGSWRGAAEELLKRLSLPRHAAVGLWAGEAGGRSIVVAAVGERKLEIEPIRVDAGGDGAVEIRGRFLGPTGGAEAYATRGAYGFSECHRVPGTALPQFRFLCPVDAGDESVILEVLSFEPGRLLGEQALLAMVAPGKAAPIKYAARSLVTTDAPMPRRDAAALLAALDGLRGGLGMAPLRHAEAQSRVAGRLLPHYVAAAHGGDPRVADMIALGLIAGWEVEGGMVRRGDFASMTLFGAASMDLALEAVLMSPAYRAVLLDPRARAIALATRDDDAGRVTTAIVSTYRFFGDVDYAATEQALLDKLDREREAGGRKPVIRVDGNSAPPLAAARQAIHGGERVDSAIEVMLQRIVGETGLGMMGLALHTTDLNSMTFPAELLKAERVQIDVDISHYQPKGSPWGMFLVLLLFTSE